MNNSLPEFKCQPEIWECFCIATILQPWQNTVWFINSWTISTIPTKIRTRTALNEKGKSLDYRLVDVDISVVVCRQILNFHFCWRRDTPFHWTPTTYGSPKTQPSRIHCRHLEACVKKREPEWFCVIFSTMSQTHIPSKCCHKSIQVWLECVKTV